MFDATNTSNVIMAVRIAEFVAEKWSILSMHNRLDLISEIEKYCCESGLSGMNSFIARLKERAYEEERKAIDAMDFFRKHLRESLAIQQQQQQAVAS